MFNFSTSSPVPGCDPALAMTRIFFEEHATAMLNVATVLGGPPAQRRCLQLQSQISEASTLAKSLRKELVWLYQLANESSAGLPVAERTAGFTMADILDPRVDEICAEATHFFNLLIAISNLDPACDVIQRKLFDPSAA